MSRTRRAFIFGSRSGSATASRPINRPRTRLERGRPPRRPWEFVRAVVSLRCGHLLAQTSCSTLWCGRIAFRSRLQSMTRRLFGGSPDGPLSWPLRGRRGLAVLVYAAWTLPSCDAATMTPPASRAPYNIRVNPTGGARTRTARPCRVSAPPAGYPERSPHGDGGKSAGAKRSPRGIALQGEDEWRAQTN